MKPERWHEASRILENALERDPDRRAAYLDEVCASDDELRLEVESLLAASDRAGSLMDSPAMKMAAPLFISKSARTMLGQSIGRYKIVSALGSGGMGEVYLAHDTRLGRRIALKLLPSHFTTDRDRLRRFEQEAHAASTLSHPNVCVIHEVGESESGYHYIAMELVDGVTLRQHLAGGPLKVTEALDVAIQVAAALTAAHAAGIVHRDIKPENIMIRADGFIKVLDFGLAKLTERPRQTTDSDVATRALVQTDVGVRMGTTTYMSPEQARGVTVDARTDIWSLGVVLYEMIAGRQPFEGETPGDLIAAILKTEPRPLTYYLPESPSELDSLARKVLEKDREARYQTAADLLHDLKEIKQEWDFQAKLGRSTQPEASKQTPPETGSDQTVTPTAGLEAVTTGKEAPARTTSSIEYLISEINQHKARSFTVLGLFLTLAFGLAYAIYHFGVWPRPSRAQSEIGKQPPSLSRLTFEQGGVQSDPTFSPDGRFLAYTSNRSGNADIWVQLIGSGDPIQITHSPADDVFPDWSPDGNSIVFRSEREGGGLFVVPAFGGQERKISSFGYAPRWSPDGSKVLFSASDPSLPASKLYLATPDGSAPREVLLPDFDSQFAGVHWHPDGQRISFQGHHKTQGFGFWIVPLAGGTPVKAEVAPEVRKQLSEGQIALYNHHWAPSGKALYCEGSSKGTQSLWKVTVDPQSLRWIAGPERLTTGGAGEWDMRISRDGKRLAYVISTETTRIWSLPFNARTGQIKGDGQPITAGGIIPGEPTMSPDGKKLLFVATHLGTQKRELIEKSLDDGRETVLTTTDYDSLYPRWSRDSTHIAYDRRFSANPDGPESDWRIVMVHAGGGDERVLNSGADEVQTDWSADGQAILALSARGSPHHYFLCLLPLSAAPHAETEMRVVASHPEYNLYYSRFSPDDRWIAFEAVKGTDLSTIYVVPAAGGEWTRITEEKGWSDKPNWSPDGRILYFVSDRITGYLNVWGIHFDPVSGKPVGEPFQITSYKSTNKMLWQEKTLMDISISEHRLVLPISEAEGSIWMLEGVDQ